MSLIETDVIVVDGVRAPIFPPSRTPTVGKRWHYTRSDGTGKLEMHASEASIAVIIEHVKHVPGKFLSDFHGIREITVRQK